ncbi:Ulp1 protease family, carboxy-terminal domain protein [Medicago truncatula]|uniref:Ulp1 protease family, carboxy-terminal domain protein n=1 Tax=Medicago truncatula TaxID=3880 RepID=A0A072TDT7_MEDTR|nr:Ulp1 protease family, carboxy-terminal domain protein [Medicago truncatula]
MNDLLTDSFVSEANNGQPSRLRDYEARIRTRTRHGHRHADTSNFFRKSQNAVDTPYPRSVRASYVIFKSSSDMGMETFNKQCPRQENGIDCGYFVMRFMKEILISKLNEIPKLYIDDFKCVTYSKDKLREIQEEWCQFMLDLKVI